MAKHTPGNWVVGEGKAARIVYASDSYAVADATVWHGGVEEAEANARLIAAAPDLLAALQVTRGQWIHSVNADECLAAIAKATDA